MHFSAYGPKLIRRFYTEYTVDVVKENRRDYRRFNYQDKDLLNFSEWNQFEIWTKEIKKDEFRMIFKLNGNIVDPFSPNNTIV